jgi:hypothetical protein
VTYRAYCLNDDGKIAAALWIEADTLKDAIEKVRPECDGRACEIWVGANRLAKVPAFA